MFWRARRSGLNHVTSILEGSEALVCRSVIHLKHCLILVFNRNKRRVVLATMEAARSARQERLDALRELRDAEAQGHGQASTSASSIHPWRRAISNIIPLPLSATAGTTLATLRPPRAASDDEDDGDDDDEEMDGVSQAGDRSRAAPKKRGKRGMEAKMAQLAEATPEGQLLRKYRNWDPSTGQARVGEWSTMKIGIEEGESDVGGSVAKGEGG